MTTEECQKELEALAEAYDCAQRKLVARLEQLAEMSDAELSAYLKEEYLNA